MVENISYLFVNVKAMHPDKLLDNIRQIIIGIYGYYSYIM